MTTTDVIAVVGLVLSFVAVVVAIIAISASKSQNEKQMALKERLDHETKTFERRRSFESLWEKMTALTDLDPDRPIGPDVRKAVNALEAVAMYWQAGIVDKEMVVISFGSVYDDLYQKVGRITRVPERSDGSGRSGHELLSKSRAISLVRDEIVKELNKKSAMTV